MSWCCSLLTVGKQALVVIAPQMYQDRELAGTRAGLEAGGFTVVIGSSAAGPCRGKFGGVEQATAALRDVRVRDYDRIAFIGGAGALAFASDSEALRIAHEAVREQVPLGAICIAPVILAKAQVLEGRRATVWDGDGRQSPILVQYGAQYTGDSVTVDGLVVTGNGPEAAEEFGRTLAALHA